MQTLSDQHDQSFGQNYGVLLEGLAVPLLARAVFVVDKAGQDRLRRIRRGGDPRAELRRGPEGAEGGCLIRAVRVVSGEW